MLPCHIIAEMPAKSTTRSPAVLIGGHVLPILPETAQRNDLYLFLPYVLYILLISDKQHRQILSWRTQLLRKRTRQNSAPMLRWRGRRRSPGGPPDCPVQKVVSNPQPDHEAPCRLRKKDNRFQWTAYHISPYCSLSPAAPRKARISIPPAKNTPEKTFQTVIRRRQQRKRIIM